MVLPLAATVLSASCSHPAATGPGNTGSGSGGDSGTPSGSGGNNNPSGNGGSGMGGDNNPTGSGGSGQMGSGGDGTIVPNDAGGDGPAMVMKMSCGDSTDKPSYAPGYSLSTQAAMSAQTTLASMGVPDLADQMRGPQPGGTIFNQQDNTNKGVKGLKFRDGPRGVCLDAEKVGNGYSTSFPVAMARSASFDVDLEYKVGDAIGDETLASGHTMLLSPTVNILRHPFWGRAQEVYGEDDYLQGRFGSAFTVGIQNYVPACAKHYAANNIENGRASINSAMDDQTLREVYANHFGMIINDGGVACIMAAYNLVQNTKATQNATLLNQILRNEFGFKGFILSDWWAMPGGQNPDNPSAYATQAVNAGLDMELPQSLNYKTLESLVPGTLQQKQLSDAALRILQQKYRFNVATLQGKVGLKTPTTTYVNGSIGNDATHVALAEQAATESMVLLKNDNNTLPFDRTKVKKVAVLGLNVGYTLTSEAGGTINFATDVRTGDRGSSRVNHDPAKAVGPFAGIQAAAGAAVSVVSGNAASAAAGADAIVVMVGLTPQDEGEEYTGAGDRGTFDLAGKAGAPQNKLVTDAAALGKPMVVVIEAGAVVDLPWLTMNSVGAVVMAWYPGMRGGAALGKLLFGDANFSGKLPITWDSNVNDWPAFHTGNSTQMDYWLGYQWFDHQKKTPTFAFGHGLSYSKFTYANLGVPCTDVTQKGVVNVTVEITNTGPKAGDEIAFLFVSYPNSQAPTGGGANGNGRHDKELKGFARVSLDPNTTKRVTIPLRISDLKYYDSKMKKWNIETGTVQVMVGPSSDNLPLKDTFTVK